MVMGPNNITMYYNGVKICSGPTPESMHQQMYLIINLAIGGKWVFMNEFITYRWNGYYTIKCWTEYTKDMSSEMIIKQNCY